MRANGKLLRVVLGASLGATLWAGCATDRRDIAYEPAGAEIVHHRAMRLDSQVDISSWHGDTHPEWRTGWNMAFPNPPFTPTVDDLSIAVDQPNLPPQAR
jgi:hypothetical protein